MESVFLRFESFDFEADGRFLNGLKDLNKCHSSQEEPDLLDLKLFFYNRFVEPIDRTSYKQWSSVSPRVTSVDCGVELPDRRTLSDSRTSKSRIAGTSDEMDAKQLSFAEVMLLVQEGKEVPGATKLDIKPTNQRPAPSQMERRLKPWEMSGLPK